MRPDLAFKNRSGIYIIRNIKDGKVYVGKTGCFYRRCHQYIYDFKNRAIGHINDYLYNAMKKHGVENFEFLPVDFAPIEELGDLELQWMTTLNSVHRNYGYNLRLDTSTGMVAAPETSVKISENLRRQWAEGVRSNHSEIMSAKWASNPERRKKQGELLSKIKTRYRYVVTDPVGFVFECDYKRLKELSLSSVLSSFHRKNCNVAVIKGHRIERFTV